MGYHLTAVRGNSWVGGICSVESLCRDWKRLEGKGPSPAHPSLRGRESAIHQRLQRVLSPFPYSRVLAPLPAPPPATPPSSVWCGHAVSSPTDCGKCRWPFYSAQQLWCEQPPQLQPQQPQLQPQHLQRLQLQLQLQLRGGEVESGPGQPGAAEGACGAVPESRLQGGGPALCTGSVGGACWRRSVLGRRTCWTRRARRHIFRTGATPWPSLSTHSRYYNSGRLLWPIEMFHDTGPEAYNGCNQTSPHFSTHALMRVPSYPPSHPLPHPPQSPLQPHGSTTRHLHHHHQHHHHREFF